LDVRTHHLMDRGEKMEVMNVLLPPLCLETERMSEFQLHERAEAALPRARGRRPAAAAAAAAPERSDLELLTAELLEEDVVATPELCKVSPLKAELILFLTKISIARVDGLQDPLAFFTEHEATLPILSRIAGDRIFNVMLCSTDVERFFKTTKLICDPQRNRLAPETVNMLASMYEWLTADMFTERSTRTKTRNASNARFATLNSNCEAECGTFISNEEDSEDD
jgi:hypothetical protein